VYLLRVVDPVKHDKFPNANMPTVEFPTAAPHLLDELAAVADVLVQPEYVYLLRMVDAAVVYPRANIPTVDVPAAEPYCETVHDEVADALVLQE